METERLGGDSFSEPLDVSCKVTNWSDFPRRQGLRDHNPAKLRNRIPFGEPTKTEEGEGCV